MKKEQVIIDRFEGKFAVCETEKQEMRDIRIDKIPSEASEGDVLVIEGEKIYIDILETKKRKEEAKKMFEKLMNANK